MPKSFWLINLVISINSTFSILIPFRLYKIVAFSFLLIIIQNEHKNYLLVYEIPEKYIEGDMYLSYNNEGTVTKIGLAKTNPYKDIVVLEI